MGISASLIPKPVAAELYEVPEKLVGLPLFERPQSIEASQRNERSLIEALKANEAYRYQVKRMEKSRNFQPEIIERLLTILVWQGGLVTKSDLASKSGLADHQLSKHLEVLARLLNIDGKPVIEQRDNLQKVKLDLGLLKELFFSSASS